MVSDIRDAVLHRMNDQYSAPADRLQHRATPDHAGVSPTSAPGMAIVRCLVSHHCHLGVSEKKGVPYFGVLIIRILLFGYYIRVPYFRKAPHFCFA